MLLTTVSWEDICYKWCASEDHFRPLIINDTTITYAGTDVNNNINERLNYDLNKIYVWLAANNCAKHKKTEFLLIGSRQKLSNVSDKIILLSMTLRLNKS